MTDKRILAGLLLAYFFALLGGALLIHTPSDRQTWAVSLAGFVVLWYTWETMHLRRAAQEQIETQLRPFVMLVQVPSGFALENVGHGPAMNIRVEDAILSPEGNIRVTFPRTISMLPPGRSEALEATSLVNGHDIGDFFSANLDPKYATAPATLTIRFQSTSLRHYSVTQTVSRDRVTFDSFS